MCTLSENFGQIIKGVIPSRVDKVRIHEIFLHDVGSLFLIILK